LLAELYKNYTQLIFRKFGGEVAQEPQKKPLKFGGNPDQFTPGLVLLRLRLGGPD